MNETFLFLSSWLASDKGLLDLTETISAFLADEADWRIPYQLHGGQQYDLIRTWPPGKHPYKFGESLDYRRGGNEQARQQIQERNVGGINAQFTGHWRNPYILNQEVYDNYAVDIFVEKSIEVPDFFSIKIKLDYCNSWFPPSQYGEILWESYDFVQEFKAAGYKLLQGKDFVLSEETSGSNYGQSYILEDHLSQENRQKVVNGIAKYVHHFSPDAAILTYYEPAEYNHHQKVISFPKSIQFSPPMYYLGRDVSISPESLENFNASFFVKEMEGVNLYLEEEHFGFLK